MDNQKIQELRALLEAVPALPWRFEQMHISKFGIRDDHGYIAFLETRHPACYGSDPEREARARFLGAMTPDTVRALLDEVERLQADKARLDSGCIITRERNEFGEDYRCERRGLNLRADIDEAMARIAEDKDNA